MEESHFELVLQRHGNEAADAGRMFGEPYDDESFENHYSCVFPWPWPGAAGRLHS